MRANRCASIFPFAFRTQASTTLLSVAFRMSFVSCPLRKRTQSAPLRRSFTRSERSMKTPPPDAICAVISSGAAIRIDRDERLRRAAGGQACPLRPSRVQSLVLSVLPARLLEFVLKQETAARLRFQSEQAGKVQQTGQFVQEQVRLAGAAPAPFLYQRLPAESPRLVALQPPLRPYSKWSRPVRSVAAAQKARGLARLPAFVLPENICAR